MWSTCSSLPPLPTRQHLHPISPTSISSTTGFGGSDEHGDHDSEAVGTALWWRQTRSSSASVGGGPSRPWRRRGREALIRRRRPQPRSSNVLPGSEASSSSLIRWHPPRLDTIDMAPAMATCPLSMAAVARLRRLRLAVDGGWRAAAWWCATRCVG